MSFWKNAFVFASGAIVGAAALTAFTGYQAFKLLKKNDTLYSAVEESVKAGVHTGGNELGNRLAKIVTDKVFDMLMSQQSMRRHSSWPSIQIQRLDIPIKDTNLHERTDVTRYIFRGQVLDQFGGILDRHWRGETVAGSLAKAKSNLNYQWKKTHNFPSGAKVILDGHYISEELKKGA